MSDQSREELERELAELEAKNAATTSWGAAVGARYERIKGIRRALDAGLPTAQDVRGILPRSPAQEPTEQQIDAAAEVIWNDRDARMGGPWSGRDPQEVVVVQTKATAKAALIAAGSLTPAATDNVVPMLKPPATTADVAKWLFDATPTLDEGQANNAAVVLFQKFDVRPK